MMEEKKTVFDHISGLFATFGIVVVIFMILVRVIGDAAFGHSLFFEYGSRALPINLLCQWFVLSVFISILKELLFTDRWISRMSMFVRIVLFFLAVTIVIVLFVIVFKWFPLNDVKAWIGFFASFAICSAVAAMISRTKEKAENLKMEQALKRYKGDE